MHDVLGVREWDWLHVVAMPCWTAVSAVPLVRGMRREARAYGAIVAGAIRVTGSRSAYAYEGFDGQHGRRAEGGWLSCVWVASRLLPMLALLGLLQQTFVRACRPLARWHSPNQTVHAAGWCLPGELLWCLMILAEYVWTSLDQAAR